jgi:two-component system chemotaxis response regulator CheB
MSQLTAIAFKPLAAHADGRMGMGARTVRVMIVQDSAAGRTATKRALAIDSELEVCATLTSGNAALKQFETQPADVAIIAADISDMDGLSLAQSLKMRAPDAVIIILYSPEQKVARLQARAAAVGVSALLPMLLTADGRPVTDSSVHEQLVGAIRLALPASAQKAPQAPSSPASVSTQASASAPESKPTPRPLSRTDEKINPGRSATPTPATLTTVAPKTSLKKPSEIPLARRPPPMRIELLAIGCSTGGPHALHRVLRGLPTDLPVPVLITQHVPAGFASLLADQLSTSSGLSVREAVSGQLLRPGEVWIATHDRHLGLDVRSDGNVIRLRSGPPEHSCRPAVDPMLREASEIYGPRLLAVVLTGMGYDGKLGCEKVSAAGGVVLAQDEETSVVWGMPGAVAMSGAAHAVLPIDRIAGEIVSYLSFGRNYSGIARSA